jgi:pepF/M3 family oligoendopeptidase
MVTKEAPVDTLPRWDLTNVYPSLDSKEFKAAVVELKSQLDELDKYLEEHRVEKTDSGSSEKDPAKLAATIDGLIHRLNEAQTLYRTLNAFIYSFISTDSYNTEAQKLDSQLDLQGVRLQKQGTQIQGWVGTIADLLPEILKHKGAAQTHEFFLKETAEQSKYLMSGPEETLAAELGLSGANAWSKLQGVVTSQLKVDFERDGKTETLPVTAILNLRSNPDEDVRRRAYEAEMHAFDGVRETLAACMNGIKGSVNTLNKRRGRQDAIHPSIDTARIDRETLEAMMGAMKDSFPMFRKYFKSKAKRLGKESLAWWDLFAPMGETDKKYTYQEAQDFIIKQFNAFSPELGSFAKHSFDNNWMDVGPRDGKRAGAFCMYVPGVKESRIMLNFDGSQDSVSTIAHELGHGFHNECAREKTELQAITPMTLAETASIMCETIVNKAAIEKAAGPQEELAILEGELNNASQVIVDITSRFIFEKEVFERRAKSELSADEISEIMLDAQEQTYGDGLDPEFRHKYMWTWKPHYYYAGFSFYNYPYAFGLLFGKGLYAIYQQRGADFTRDYRDLLASTGLGDAAELAARFDIDIRNKKFWQDSLAVIGETVERYAAL